MPTNWDTPLGRSDIARRAHEYTEQELENLIREARVTEPGWWKSPAGAFKFFLVLLGLVLLAAFVYQRLLLGVESRLAALLPNGAQLATALVAVVAAHREAARRNQHHFHTAHIAEHLNVGRPLPVELHRVARESRRRSCGCGL